MKKRKRKAIGLVFVVALLLLATNNIYASEIPGPDFLTPELMEKMQSLRENAKPQTELPGQIPEKELKTIPSEKLVELFLSHPGIVFIDLYSGADQGLNVLTSKYNGLRELLKRKDVFSVLLATYAQMDPEGYNPDDPPEEIGKHIAHLRYVEKLLSQNDVLKRLEKKDADQLLAISLEKYQGKANQIKKYGRRGLQATARLIGKLFKTGKCGDENASVAQNKDVIRLLEDDTLASVEVLNTIISSATKNGCH